MKYMGSKRTMLANGFGEAIIEEAAESTRVVDLFAGSAAVSWFAAENTRVPVRALDLQSFSAVLSRAVLSRTRSVDPEALIEQWISPVRRRARRSRLYTSGSIELGQLDAAAVYRARELCAARDGRGPLWSAYGGHYFSPQQALLLDLVLDQLPEREPVRSLCHAAIIVAAGYCAAAPGHTAQPFQPTATSLPYIRAHWGRDPLAKAAAWLRAVAPRHAKRKGSAAVGDALLHAKTLSAGDLVIIDPPYSAVQYSRFYHVLEAVAQGQSFEVSGVGRYPPREQRPSSDFSLKTKSETALTELLDALAEAQCRALLTFPAGQSSNGLSGARIVELARERFTVSSKTVLGRFSTLGGNNTVRASRRASAELILRLSPV
jgi:adenine-specific DNA-methyltransferase